MNNNKFILLISKINNSSKKILANVTDFGPLEGHQANMWRLDCNGLRGAGYIVIIGNTKSDSFSADAQVSCDSLFHHDIPPTMSPSGASKDKYDNGVMSFRLPFLWGDDHWWRIVDQKVAPDSDLAHQCGTLRSGSVCECVNDFISSVNRYFIPYLKSELL